MTRAVRVILFGLIALPLTACNAPVPGDTATSEGTIPTRDASSSASIEGIVWHDLCDSGSDGEPALTLTPPGCIEETTALGRYHADGERQPAEPGLPGVTLTLSSGACPGSEVLQTILSEANGAYTFSGLDAGTYCVSIDPTSAANQPLLPPGLWTHPLADQEMASTDVNLHAGEKVTGIEFGWDEQFRPVHVHAAVWDSQSRLQVIDTGAPLDVQAPPTPGLMLRGGIAGDEVVAYADSGPAGQMPAIIAQDGALRRLDFVQTPDYNVAIWPGQSDQSPRLAWSVMPTGGNSLSRIMVGDLAGSATQSVYSEPLDMNMMSHLLVQRWSADGQSLLFSREPLGIGGYIIFNGASSLYRLHLSDGQVSPLVAFDTQGRGILCLDAVSPDGSAVASHCPVDHISVIHLDGSPATTVTPPSGLSEARLTGSARFSPDGSRIAYALARGDPQNEKGWVAVSDELEGASTMILEGDQGGYYTVVGWLNPTTLLLQRREVACTSECSSTLWTIGIDGSQLKQVGQGDFITLANAGLP